MTRAQGSTVSKFEPPEVARPSRVSRETDIVHMVLSCE